MCGNAGAPTHDFHERRLWHSGLYDVRAALRRTLTKRQMNRMSISAANKLGDVNVEAAAEVVRAAHLKYARVESLASRRSRSDVCQDE